MNLWYPPGRTCYIYADVRSALILNVTAFIQRYVPIHNFRVASDLAVQLGVGNTMTTLEELSNSRRARFELNARNQSTWVEGRHSHNLIDELMEQVPGKDGYGATLVDDSFGVVATSTIDGNPLNTAFYSRCVRQH